MPTGDDCALENEVNFSLREGVYTETTSVTILRTFVTVTTMILCKINIVICNDC